MLYKAKKKIGKGSTIAADTAAKKGFTKTSQFISGTAQKTHSGTMKAKKLAKEQWEEGEGYGTEFKLCQPEEYGMHDTIDNGDVHIMDVKGKKTRRTSSTIFGAY